MIVWQGKVALVITEIVGFPGFSGVHVCEIIEIKAFSEQFFFSGLRSAVRVQVNQDAPVALEDIVDPFDEIKLLRLKMVVVHIPALVRAELFI